MNSKYEIGLNSKYVVETGHLACRNNLQRGGKPINWIWSTDYTKSPDIQRRRRYLIDESSDPWWNNMKTIWDPTDGVATTPSKIELESVSQRLKDISEKNTIAPGVSTTENVSHSEPLSTVDTEAPSILEQEEKANVLCGIYCARRRACGTT
ncbi:uncharacterized protein CEXT_754371 [Caerostris extrusa]|uniref:Uncharacterized protein n=1 Tax=Caerostris extrusa TaxID=172846 RepID=A0AAV4YAZ0_CAEEX|nr:uncharacterized protein CEXT_754371 [Caerostris extrusa]